MDLVVLVINTSIQRVDVWLVVRIRGTRIDSQIRFHRTRPQLSPSLSFILKDHEKHSEQKKNGQDAKSRDIQHISIKLTREHAVITECLPRALNDTRPVTVLPSGKPPSHPSLDA